jgi:tetratricopeptide (TPR) repeat protein
MRFSAAVSGGLLLIVLAAAGCSGGARIWPRYQLEKAFFTAQKELELASLQAEKGQAVDRAALQAAFERVTGMFETFRAGATAEDSMLFRIGGDAYLRLADIYAADSNMDAAARLYQTLVVDTIFPVPYRRLAAIGLGRTHELAGRYVEATAQYRRLVAEFYPPVGDGGVNKTVLSLPRKLASLAGRYAPDSAAHWRSEGFQYYEALAEKYPHSELSVTALGELGKMYLDERDWPNVIATLERATDTAGTVLPAYWVDIAEICAGQLGDTAKALTVYARIAERFPESPFRADADIKRAQILLRQARYADARDVLATLKDDMPDKPGAVLPAQLLFALAWAQEGNWERAKNEYLYLVTTYPRSLQAIEAALAMARRFTEEGKTERVAEWYNRADELATELSKPGKRPPALTGQAMDFRVVIAVERKEWENAAARLADIVDAFGANSPAGGMALIQLGWMNLRERGDTAAAAQSWRRFIETYPNHAQRQELEKEMKKWPKNYNQDMSS